MRSGASRAPGVIVALAMAGAFAGVIGFFLVRGGGSASAPRAQGLGEAPPPDVRDLRGASGLGGLGSGRDVFMQVADRDDPGRVAAEIRARRAEPLEGKRYRLDEPRAWVFLKDGRTLLITAERGEASFPDARGGGRPEEGFLEGDVRARLYAAKADGAAIDPATDVPVLTALADVVRFDATLGQATVPGGIEVKSEQIAFRGEGLDVLFSEVTQRLERLRLARSFGLTYTPRARAEEARGPETSRDATARSNTGAPGGEAAGTVSPEALAETRYELVAEEGVKLSQGRRSVRGDRMMLWLRLIDNTLPSGALGPGTRVGAWEDRGALEAMPTGLRLALELASVPFAAVSWGQPESSRRDDELPVTLTWDGPLEIKPLEETPAELRENDAFVRFIAREDRAVELSDGESGATGAGATAEYAITRGELALAGRGTGESAEFARLTLPGSGEAQAGRLEVSLTTGLARALGEGFLRTERRDAAASETIAGKDGTGGAADGVESQAASVGEALVSAPVRVGELAWSTRADFSFAVVDGRMTSRLTEARAQGRATLTDRSGTLSADSLIAAFADQEPARDEAVKAVLSSMTASGSVLAEDAQGGSLAADALRVEFDTLAAEPSPARMTVSGGVRAQRRGSVLSCDRLRVEFAERDERGRAEVSLVVAEQGVKFAGEGGEVVEGEALSADPGTQVVLVTGAPATLTRGDSALAGPAIRLEGTGERLVVMGEGGFTHMPPPSAPGERATVASVTWTRGMVYDGTAGEIRCDGDVDAVLTQGETSRDALQADRIVLTLEAVASEAAAQEQPGAEGTREPFDFGTPLAREPRDQRRVVRMLGQSGSAGELVKVELRRYAAEPSAERRLEQLVYLEGATIDVGVARGTLDVPGRGRLLLMDRTPGGEARGASVSDALAGGDARGTALFSWAESMALDRRSGEIRFVRDVRLTHDTVDRQRTVLEGDGLTAWMTPLRDGGLTEPAAGMQLLRAEAVGAVRVSGNDRQIEADRLLYDAQGRRIEAQAGAGRRVTMSGRGSPVSGSGLVWDLAQDRVEVRDIGPVTTPTGGAR